MAGMWIKRSSWSSIKNMWIRTTAGWSPVRSGYIRVNTSGTGWKRFWFKANLPNEITKPRFNTTNTSGTGTIYDGPTATSPQYLNENLFGKDGTYSNYTAISDRKISYGDTDTADINSRTVIVYDDRFTSAGGVTTANRISVDDKYLFYEMTVSNGTDPLNSINSISNGIKMIKSQPKLGPFTTSLTGNATPLSTLTFNYNLENFYYNRVEQANSKIRWWRSSTQSASGFLLKEQTISATLTSSDSSSLSGQSTYTIEATADNDSYIVVEIVAGSSWTRHFGYNNAYQIASFSSAKVQPPYRFSFGKTIYVGTNGYIGLDSGSYSPSNLPDGRSIAIFVKDLTQYYLAEYSDSSVYYLYIKSYLYNTSASSVNALDYQIKFYNDPNINYCDIYIVRKGSNVGSFSDISTGYYGAWGQTDPKYAGMVGPYSISQGTVFRVYFGDQAGTTSGIPWTAVNNNLWDIIQEWSYPPGLDDDWTAVVSAANQSAPFPTNTSAPTLTTDTGNFSAGSTITLNTGTWTGTNSYLYEILYGGSTPIATDSTATKTLINTNQYVITNADASAPSYYFRGRVTGYSGSGQTGNSAQAFTTTSARSTLNPTTTISVGTSTETGFTISGTAGPLTGFGTTYVNITEIQIYNSSQSLVSTITTGLPTVNGTTGAWSYVWTGHSGSQATYYAKVKVTATDSDQTTFTTGFSSSISTLAALSSPTISSVSYSTSNNTWTVNYTGGSGPYYQIWYQPSSSSTGAPTLNGDATSIADASSSDSSSTSRVLTPSSGFVYWWWVRSAKTLNATGAGNVSAWNGPVTMSPMNTAIPTLTGTAKVGQTLTYGIGTWINSSSQDLRLYRGTASVATSETLAASSASTSATYTIPSSDFTDPNNRKYYRSFANVSNPSFSSGFVAGTEIGPLVNVTLYTITFDSQGGTSVSSLTQSTEGGSIAKPTDPTRSGYSFGGWATSSTGTTAVSWPRTPSSDETLYAIWSQNVVAPSAPSSVSWGTHSYAYVSGSLSTTLSPSASGNATKVQSWTYQSRVTFNYSWSSVTGATSYEVFTSSSSTAPTSTSTGTDVGNTTTGSFTAVQTNRGTLNRYAWVRAVNSAGKSGWTAAGLTTSTATVVSGLSTAGNVKICRTNTTTCTNASGVANTDLSYTYSGVNTGFSHVAYLSNITISGTTGLSANS